VKLILTFFLFAAFSTIAYSQILNQDQIIKRIIDSGAFEGHDQKIIGGMGDAAAVTVTKALGERKLTSSEADSVLIVLTSAFADPSMVQDVADREPKTTLLVLQYLNLSASDAQLKARIAETRSYVLEHYGKYIKSSVGK
jgi:hypothetical protein